MNNVQRILKRVLACTAAIVLAVTLCLAAAAEVAYQPTAQFFVNDFADVLSAQTEQEIVELGRALQQQTGAQAVAVTVPSLGGQSVEDYAIDLANSWGIGQAEEDNGVLILIAVEERKLRVEVGLGLEGALPDGKPQSFLVTRLPTTKILKQTGYSHCVNLDFTDCTCDPSADPAARFPRARISVLLVLRRAARATRRRRKRHLRRRFSGGIGGGGFGGGGGFPAGWQLRRGGSQRILNPR